jgi:hypothetical protein
MERAFRRWQRFTKDRKTRESTDPKIVMFEPEKACVFCDANGTDPELLVSYPEFPLSLTELWVYVQRARGEQS